MMSTIRAAFRRPLRGIYVQNAQTGIPAARCNLNDAVRD